MKLDEVIKKIKNGEMSIENDLEFQEAIKALDYIFPNDDSPIASKKDNYQYYKYTLLFDNNSDYWTGILTSHIPTIKASELLRMIEEPEFNPKFGDKVYAWDDYESDGGEFYFIGYIKSNNDDEYGYCCTQDFKEFCNTCSPATEWFKNIKPIPQKTKVTLQEIADWKNVSPDDIEIV